MTPAAKLKQAVETVASKGERAAYRQALRDVLEDIEYIEDLDAHGRLLCCSYALTAKIKARLESNNEQV